MYAAFSGMYNGMEAPTGATQAAQTRSSFGVREYDPLYDDPPPGGGGGGGGGGGSGGGGFGGGLAGAITVVIPKPLGLTLKNLPDEGDLRGTFVSKVKEGSNAAMTGRINTRMLVVTVGGVNVRGANSKVVANQIRAMPSPVHIGLLPMYD